MGLKGDKIKMISDEAVDLLNQIQIMQEFNRIFPKDVGLRTLFKIIKIFYDHGVDLWREFIGTVLTDPVAFRTMFIVHTPLEEFELRLRLSQLSPPLRDHQHLCLLAKQLRKTGWESYVVDLAGDFLYLLMVDLQKLMGKPGTISELRKNFETISTEKDGTVRIETDLWPRAKIVRLFKSDRIEVHVHPLEEEPEWLFNNLADRMMIGWMQSFSDREIRDSPYTFQEGKAPVFCYVYRADGRLMKKQSFPFALREKYAPLIHAKAEQYPLEREGVKYTDAEQEIETAFFQAILGYTPEKGSPPGYFKMVLKEKGFRAYQKAKRTNIDFTEGSLDYEVTDEDVEDGKTRIEFVANEPKDEVTLIAKTIVEDPQIKDSLDEVDRIILENYGKSDPEILAIATNQLRRKISRQAIQKRRKKIDSLLKGLIEFRTVVHGEENRGGIEIYYPKRSLDTWAVKDVKDSLIQGDSKPTAGRVKFYTKKQMRKLEKKYRAKGESKK